MNKLEVIVKEVRASGGVILADLVADDCMLSAMLTDATGIPEWLIPGNTLYAVFKETEVSLAVEFSGKLSIRNRIPCTVENINRGELLSVIFLNFNGTKLSSAITTRSVDLLGIKPGDSVLALIKANEISIMQK